MIVGHGPSVLSGLGSVIDSHETVVRLKECKTDAEHFGTRTDYLCARSNIFEKPVVPFWLFPVIQGKWLPVYRKFGTAKPSTGLCAVFCVLEYLNPPEIALIGYDQLLHGKAGKYNDRMRTGFTAHDGNAEAKCLASLPVKIIDLAREHEQVHRL